MTFEKYRCPELDCTGTLEELPEHEQTTSDEYTEAWCEDCNRHYVLLQCENCGSTSFDHTEVLSFPGWVDAKTHLHTKNDDRASTAEYAETQSITCSDCGHQISLTPPEENSL